MTFPEEGTPIRFSRRKDELRQAAIDAEPGIMIADISNWLASEATFDRDTLVLAGTKSDESVLLESPPFFLPPDTTVYFSLFVVTSELCGLRLSLRSPFRSLADHAVHGSGELALSFRYASRRGGKFTLSLAGYQPDFPVPAKLRIARLVTRVAARSGSASHLERKPSYARHWKKWQRSVHYICSQSRWFNAAVATWEMHLGQAEVLSLPQYMAICPTGQCNASCGFCSVTTNRTGIIKKQLPFEALDQFLSPIVGTLRLFGLEGNGEPTLYDHFDELLFKVTSRDAPVYLITNGERLTADQIALLLASPTDAINFSLNAATGETHRRVMKFKGWDAVVQNISRFVRWRGDARGPSLSVSIVVTRDNAHEVQQFLHFSEWHLKVDRILIRPLSEIANDSGVVEDMRDLVPYESQIGDMLDAVAEYLEFVPRRAEILVDPAAFSAFRHEPRNVLVSPPGFDQQLLVPRREDWQFDPDQTKSVWHLNRLDIFSSVPKQRILAKSGFVPVVAERHMTFRCCVHDSRGPLRVAVVDESGNVLGSEESEGESPAPQLMTIRFLAPPIGGVAVELSNCGRIVASTVDFGRMYAWPAVEARDIKLPHDSRWQVDTPGTIVRWSGNELSLEAQAPPGIYLYRSYTVSVAPDESFSFAIRLAVEQGALGIGILSDDGNKWLAAGRYLVGSHLAELSFNTSSFCGFQVVLYTLTDEPLRVRVDWGNNIGQPPEHKSRVIEPRQLLLPNPANWIVDLPGAAVSWSGSVVEIGWNVVDSVSRQLVNVDGLYLLRSRRFPCPHLYNERPTVALRVSVKSGRLGIGFLGGKTEALTVAFYFPVGEHERILEVDTDGQQSLMVVLFSSMHEPLMASVDWGKTLNLDLRDARQEWCGGLFDPRADEPDFAMPVVPKQLLLPAQKRWVLDPVGGSVQWIGTSMKLVCNDPKSVRLVHSPLFPVAGNDNEVLTASVQVTVVKGQLSIGFASSKTEQPANAVTLHVGKHDRVLEIDTHGQNRLMVVLFSDTSEPLDATVEWGDNFLPESQAGQDDSEPDPDVHPKPKGIAARLARIYAHAGVAGVMRKATGVLVRRLADQTLFGFLAFSFRRLGELTFNRLLKRCFPSRTIYCQKPWTDLNNFTVDGRMDVCCIATGPSQQRYALGNIYKHDFQKIWNGEQMKEFRRTVNAKDKLPPCARCPMANNYRPPF
jgi:radical SAM protein with 4Fe4S-binding SPASM domain